MADLRTPPSVVPRIVAFVATGLMATLLPLLVSSGPAAAADCLDETVTSGAAPLRTGCDDTTPPAASIASVAPASSPTGFTRSTSVTFTFSGTPSAGDTGTIAFECQFYNTAAQPTTWTACTSPQTYNNLEEFVATPYTFRVRAIDATDNPVQACDANPFLDNCLGDPDVADFETAGAVTTLKVDATPPNTFLNREPVDQIRPDSPVVLTASPVLEVNSNEPGTSFACTVNGKSLSPCGPGLVTLTNLRPGRTTFVARAVDRAFNLDPTPVTTSFFVPRDIRRSKGSAWQTKRKPGLFDNDYVEARKVGDTLVIKGIRKVREVRLIAPVGPKFGTIELRVGSSQWYTVDLHAKRARLAQLLVRDEFSPLQSGTIQIRVTSLRGKGSSVRLDALVARG